METRIDVRGTKWDRKTPPTESAAELDWVFEDIFHHPVKRKGSAKNTEQTTTEGRSSTLLGAESSQEHHSGANGEDPSEGSDRLCLAAPLARKRAIILAPRGDGSPNCGLVDNQNPKTYEYSYDSVVSELSKL
jgi:hypothetical protein